MSPSVATVATERLRHKFETRPRMARAALKKLENDPSRIEAGRILQQALSLLGWTARRFAQELEKDEAQINRWLKGTETYPFAAILRVEELRQPFLVAQGERLDGASVETVVRVTRRIA